MAFHHYVQRGLMKFWSTPLPNGSLDGFVWSFDFATGRAERIHSKRLFGVEDLHSEEVESRLGRLIESPLAQFLRFATDVHATNEVNGRTVIIKDQAQLRALGIAFLFQTARGMKKAKDKAEAVSMLLGFGEQKLQQLGALFMEHNSISTCRLPSHYLLCLSESGWFPCHVQDAERGPIWAQAIPLTPSMALVSVPKGVAVNVAEVAPLLASNSIGIHGPNRLVLPAAMVTENDPPELLKKLPSLRTKLQTVYLGFEELRKARTQKRKRAGLPEDNIAGLIRHDVVL